jgi:hypothetical protein
MNPPTGTDLVPYVEPFRMTEREARTAGMTSNRLSGLRGSLRQGIKGGQLNVRTTNGNLALALTMVDTVGGFTTRSDIARTKAEVVAEAACKGLITTQTTDGTYGSVWRLTAIGLHTLGLVSPQLEMKQ